MKVFQCFSNNFKKLFSFCFLQTMQLFRKQIIVQRISSTIFLNEIDLGVALNHINQLGNDLMAQFRKNVYLSFKIFQFVRFIQAFFLINFYRYFLVCTLANPHLHDTVSTFPQLFIYLIILQLLLSLDFQINIQELLFASRYFRFFFLLDLLVFQFVHVVWSKLLLQKLIYQVFILYLGPLLFFLQRLLASFRVRIPLFFFLAYRVFYFQIFVRAADRCFFLGVFLDLLLFC